MKISDLLALRLSNQGLAGPGFARPEEVVGWLGAVQSQDYLGAKWALGQRVPAATDASIEQAFNEGRFLRTHVLRPTWHFVLPGDIRWMLKLTAPRVKALIAFGGRANGLDETVIRRSRAAITTALREGPAQREHIASALEAAGIDVKAGQRLIFLLMHAELDGLICSGPRRGKQFTYALLDQRIPGGVPPGREESLTELARRYFTSHGPATLRDFAWWSGLTLADSKRAVEALGHELERLSLEGGEYWFVPSGRPARTRERGAWLLPNFDEYIVAYTERGEFFDPIHDGGRIPSNSMLSRHSLLLDGRVAGAWKRTLKKDSVLVEFFPFAPLPQAESRALRQAAQRYADFLGLALEMQ